MVSRSVAATARRTLRVLTRAWCVLAVTVQVLIPVGYMPTALAEGWPLRLCHTVLPDGFVFPDAPGMAVADGHGHPSHHALHPGGRDHTARLAPIGDGAEDSTSYGAGDSTDDADELSRHCPLGGLSTLTPVPADALALPMLVATDERPALDHRPVPTARACAAFRARAPPRHLR